MGVWGIGPKFAPRDNLRMLRAGLIIGIIVILIQLALA